MKDQFLEIIKDDRSKTYEVIGLSSNDTVLTKMTRDMQKAGMGVRCETVCAPATKKTQSQATMIREDSRRKKGFLTDLRKNTEKRLRNRHKNEGFL